jgi:hypothetical protein
MIITLKPVTAIQNQLPPNALKAKELGIDPATKKLYIGLSNGTSVELLTGQEVKTDF